MQLNTKRGGREKVTEKIDNLWNFISHRHFCRWSLIKIHADV